MYKTMDALLAGFNAQIETFVDSLEDAELAVGNGVPVFFDKNFAEEYGVNRPGRMTITAGVKEFHAAPIKFDMAPCVQTSVHDATSQVLSFATARPFDFAYDRSVPKSRSTIPPTGVPHRYEPVLLRDLIRTYGHVTLVNPALATLWRCQNLGEWSIFLTDKNPAYIFEINQIVGRWVPSQTVPFVKVMKGVAYLGTNGPRPLIMDRLTVPWVALFPNPYQVDFPYDEYSLMRHDNRVVMRYVRKDRPVTIVVLDQPEHYRYNPKQVDAKYRTSSKDDQIKFGVTERYYLETNSVLLQMPYVEGDVGESIGRLAAYPDRQGDFVQDDQYLYDAAPFIGTYLSRRSYVALRAVEIGKKLAPLTQAGIFTVTTECLVPFVGPFASEFDHAGSHYITCSGDFDLQPITDPVHFGYVYGKNLMAGIRVTPFIEGAYVRVPFDPVARTFHFLPPVPGTYFFFPTLSTLYAFQLPVLFRLYGSRFRPKKVPYVPLDYETADVSSYIHGVLHELPLSPVRQSGISLGELARLSRVSALFLRDVLPSYTGVFLYSEGGVEYVASIDRINEPFDTDKGLRQFREIWNEWIVGSLIKILPKELHRFRETMNYVGRPIISSRVAHGFIEAKGTILRNYNTRKAELVETVYESPVIDKGYI